MPMMLKVELICDVGRCRSGGNEAGGHQPMTIAISPNIEQLSQALKQLPTGWKRDDKGVVSCTHCSETTGRILDNVQHY